ncbi:MAG: aminoacetone oxidase family FAD-binding enzyme [Bacillales bacterium]|jgi:predicted Rossmann fold flavoprotein|nr:aminoacetone oxidase family FAD-binding enzyme [Bacillales bacterium]
MKILVIGGGPAGMMLAGQASKKHQVILIEQNEKLGKKLFLTGKGKCNISTSATLEEFEAKIVRGKSFLKTALTNFTYENCLDFFKDLGCPLKIERGKRIFPVSEKSSDIIKALSLYCKNVDVKLNEKVIKVIKVNEQYKVITSKGQYVVDKVVVATGGLSYAQTGATGDGYKLFKQPLIETKQALVPINIKAIPLRKCLKLKNVKLICEEIELFGELDIYSSKIEGPLGIMMSSLINRKENIALFIDFKPALSLNQLQIRLDNNKYKDLSLILKDFLPLDIIPTFLTKCQNKKDIPYYLKRFPLDYLKLDSYSRAIITSGGIDINYIDAVTFESKINPHVYYIGEVLDVDALTGGYNLHIALAVAKQCAEYI